jgi:NAD(P)-dependent dehydrogenase (short-subunit alcohol dehydrogenase family)
MANHTKSTPQPGVAVITGASAGVGRAVVESFARRGWRLGLVARAGEGLEAAVRDAEAAGAPAALALPADVADAEAVFAAADRVASEFGGIDVWVNDAMVTIFAPVHDVSPEEFRRVTEVTYLGQVHGTMAALRHMRSRNRGTIVQVGSALAYRAIPLQAAYCGAKFAIRGFTDSLRTELLHEGSRIRLTMVQLPAVNTPQFDWARSRMPHRVQPVPPIHQPEPIAEAIYSAAIDAPRELWVGWPSVKAIVGNLIAPGLLDRYLARTCYQGQMTDEPADAVRPDNLFIQLQRDHGSHGRFDQRARTQVTSVDPATLRGGLVALGIALCGVALSRFGRGSSVTQLRSARSVRG